MKQEVVYKILAWSVVMLIGCGEATTTSGSSSSSSGGSSSSSGAFVCPSTPTLIAPLDHENRVHACRRFGPGDYKHARIGWRTEGICTEQLAFTWAIDKPDTRTGFVTSPHVFVPENGIVSLSANVPEGEALFACVVLKVLAPDRRSCVEGCRFEGDPDSFWGNTGPDGNLINPFELESLSVSPTAMEAAAWGNDKTRLMIDAFETQP